MKIDCRHIRSLLAAFALLLSLGSSAQYKVRGTVFDSSHRYTIEAVTVMSTGGKGTATDSLGRYSIDVAEKDSIWFSFLGRTTPRYPVLKIQDVNQFDISLRLKMVVLKEVTVRSRLYKEDSVQNRRDYAKAFNFQRPNLASITSVTATGAGFDINEIIRLFQFKKNRQMEKFRERLLDQEREKYVTYRFGKALVRRLTGLDGEPLNKFMEIYRPSYEFTLLTPEYDFQLYIKKAGEAFKTGKAL